MSKIDSRPYEAQTLVFIIKMWCEEMDKRKDVTRWRGYITLVPTGERQYVDSIEQITDFIQAQFATQLHVRIQVSQHRGGLWQRITNMIRRRS